MSEPQTNTCECKAEEIALLPCAGGSNCGQITNRVAVKLDEEGIGRSYCLPASFIETQDWALEDPKGQSLGEL